MMAANPLGIFPLGACILVGVGVGGFFDGIVFHRLLQWHHVVSTWYPPTSLENLRLNTLWDGIFHSVVYAILVVAFFLVWRTASHGYIYWSARLVMGSALMGWGIFNLIEGLVDHHVLEIHHLNETAEAAHRGVWDIAFLFWVSECSLWAGLCGGKGAGSI